MWTDKGYWGGGGGGERWENQSPDPVLPVDRCRGLLVFVLLVVVVVVVVVLVLVLVPGVEGEPGVDVLAWFVDDVRGGIAVGDWWGLEAMSCMAGGRLSFLFCPPFFPFALNFCVRDMGVVK